MNTTYTHPKDRKKFILQMIIAIFLTNVDAAMAWDCNTDCSNACTSIYEIWSPFPLPGHWNSKEVRDPFCYKGCLLEKQLDCKIGANTCDMHRINRDWRKTRLAMKEANRHGVIQSQSHCYQIASGGGMAASLVKFLSKLEGPVPIAEMTKHFLDCACSAVDWKDPNTEDDDDANHSSDFGAWSRKPGLAIQIASNDRGDTYALGLPIGPFGHTLYQWFGGDWVRTSGQGTRIAVDTKGKPWVVNNRNEIWFIDESTQNFTKLNMQAVDIGIGAEGSFYILSTESNQFGNLVYRYTNNGWVKTGGAGIRLAVDSTGHAIVINKQLKIFRFDSGNRWFDLGGFAHDVAVAGGRIFVIGTNKANVGYGIWTKHGSSAWETLDGAGTSIAGGNNRIWVTNSLGHIYRRKIINN